MNAEHERRFLDKVLVGDGCWPWLAARTPKGYGQFAIHRRANYAHRVAYELFREPIPAGMQIDHLCRNRVCVRPSHLEVVTSRTNILRGTSPAALHAAATHCPRGHPYDETNTRTRPQGWRDCRACNRLRWGNRHRQMGPL